MNEPDHHGHRQRLRERFIRSGLEGFHDYEVVELLLTCDPHTYEKAGKYRILIKVIDIFGNDTSQAFDVEVK